MFKAKLTTIGNSVGVILPKEALARLKVEKGDMLAFVETPEGYRVQAYDPDFETAMKAYERTARKYRNALRELAK
jgi:putative addiction module antidote